MTPDLAALRAALERQAQALAPIATHLHAATVHPPIAPHDWHGPASDSYLVFEQQLRTRIVAAETVVADALRSTRLAIRHLGG